jgi:NADPH:quinone reductase-like Zn-dependent oxidoreductase
MRAIVTSTHGGPDVLTITELPDPQPADGEVVIDIEAFGLNHAELYFRDGRWGDLDVAPVTGIECAGTIALDRTGRLAPGTKVVAIMGGMGRTRNGTYAEKVSVPATNVVAVDTGLSWADLVAVPETYATAWTTLHHNLAVAPGQTVLVRGATSALGQAVVNIAADFGVAVIATTRNPERRALLFDLGAKDVLLDDGGLATQAQAAGIVIDAAVDLVGSSALRDTLAVVRPGGRVCQIGFLGGLGPVVDFDPLVDLPSGVQLSFFGSFMFGSEHFPLDAVPVQELIAKAEAGVYQAKPARVFGFDEVPEAHKVMEANQALGKLVVSVH